MLLPLEAINIAGQWKASGFFSLKLTLFEDHCILCKVLFFSQKREKIWILFLIYYYYYYLVFFFGVG
jgi:hypothetical protein